MELCDYKAEYFFADRPFVYHIVDTTSKNSVFTGRLTKLASNFAED